MFAYMVWVVKNNQSIFLNKNINSMQVDSIEGDKSLIKYLSYCAKNYRCKTNYLFVIYLFYIFYWMLYRKVFYVLHTIIIL